MWFVFVVYESRIFHLALMCFPANSFSSAFLEPLKALRGAPRGRDHPEGGSSESKENHGCWLSCGKPSMM